MKSFFFIFVLCMCFLFKKNETLVSPVKFNGKYGFIDTRGNWIIKPVFDSVGIFYNGYADSYKNGKTGIINSSGELIINHVYDYIGNFENDRALVITNDSVNYIDLKGNFLLNRNLYNGEDFSEGLAAVQYKLYGKWGFINTHGELVIDTIFEYTSNFRNGKASVDIKDLSLEIDSNGNIKDTIIEYSVKKYKLFGQSNNGTLGMTNYNGKVIMQGKYKAFGYKQNNSFWFNERDKYGIADTTGRIIVEPKFDYLTYFADNGLALAKLNGKWGYVDKNGKTVINFQFDKANGFKYGLAAVKKDKKWGFINKDGRFIIKPKYEYSSSI